MKRYRLPLFVVPVFGALIAVPEPVSGGNHCPRRVVTVTTAEDLKRELENADFAGTILIPSGTRIDVAGERWLPVRSCVTIKSTRHGLDPGALLYTDQHNDSEDEELDYEPLFHVIGERVRIEGLRFEGPLPSTDRRRTRRTVGAVLIGETANDVLIDNNYFAFWNWGVRVQRPGLTWDQARLFSVTRNYFNRNANERHGYGVGVHRGYVWIEGNLFNGNRHVVAATGTTDGGKGYIARHNYVLEKGFTVDGYWNQHFDVHGSGSGGYGGTAGEYFEIEYNTIRGEQTYGPWPFEKTRPAFMLRGKPTARPGSAGPSGAYFEHNVVVHDDASEAVRLKRSQCVDANPANPLNYSPEHCNLHVGPNSYNTDTTDELAVGDFDGDGRDDVFLANGTGWWYSSAGLMEWRFLRPSSFAVGDLRFGDFDGDGRTDVLSREGPTWWVSSGGTGLPRAVRSDGTRLSDCVFGYFDDDDITDALRADGSTWSVSLGAGGPWLIQRGAPRHPAADVRVGDFNGDGIDDVFWIENGLWSVWYPNWNAVGQDVTKPVRQSDMDSLVVADFDGDGRADLGKTDGAGWSWLRGGTSNWERLRGSGDQPEYKDIRAAVLGRFTPETPGRRLAAIRYATWRFPEESKHGFVLWDGTGDAFVPWTPHWQEMR